MKERRSRTEPAAAVEADGSAPLLLPVLTGIIAFLIYLRTLTPGMQTGDGTELAACAYILGVPHPTGYPFYMLLLKLCMVLTGGGDAIIRSTTLNAGVMASAAAVTSLILLDTFRALFPTLRDKLLFLVCGAGALSTAFMRSHWSAAVVTEVYALQFLLMVLFTRSVQKYSLSRSSKHLVLATLWMGLGLAHHRLSLFMIPVLAGLWVHCRRRGTSPHLFALHSSGAALLLLSSLLLYLYLPLRAAAQPRINWGNPATAVDFIHHVRGGDFVSQRFLRPNPAQTFTASTYCDFAMLVSRQLTSDVALQILPVSMRSMGHQSLGRSFYEVSVTALIAGVLIMAAALSGAIIWFRRQPLVSGSAGLVALMNLALLYLYNIADIADYYLYPFWLGALCVSIGLIAGVARLATRLTIFLYPVGAYACLIFPALLLFANWNPCDRSNDLAAEQMSAAILPETDVMPRDSILITGGDTDIYTCWYRQLVRGERRDVLVFGGNFIHRPWYRSFFSPEQIDRYCLRFSDRTPYDPAEFASQLAEGIIDANIKRYPIFTCTMDPFILQQLSKRYAITAVVRQVDITLYRIQSSTGSSK